MAYIPDAGDIDDFIKLPFVSASRSLSPDANREMASKPVRPKPDRFPTGGHAVFSQEIFSASSAQSKR